MRKIKWKYIFNTENLLLIITLTSISFVTIRFLHCWDNQNITQQEFMERSIEYMELSENQSNSSHYKFDIYIKEYNQQEYLVVQTSQDIKTGIHISNIDLKTMHLYPSKNKITFKLSPQPLKCIGIDKNGNVSDIKEIKISSLDKQKQFLTLEIDFKNEFCYIRLT